MSFPSWCSDGGRALRFSWSGERRYVAGEGRDLRLDLLRGYFVFAMVADHAKATSSWLSLLTGGNQFFTSAAEGFVFTAGLVLGLIAARAAGRGRPMPSVGRLWWRAGRLYALALALRFGSRSLCDFLGLPWDGWDPSADPAVLLTRLMPLWQLYWYGAILVLHAQLLIVAPVAIWMLRRGRTRWVLALTCLLYVAHQLRLDALSLPWPILSADYFDFSAWQLLFFGGLVLGFHRERVRSVVAWLPRRAWLFGSGSALLALGVLFVANRVALHAPLLADVFAKPDLHLGRLVAFAAFFCFVYAAATELWGWLVPTVGRLLLPLGQHALLAYTVHAPIVAVAWLVRDQVGPGWERVFGFDLALQVATIGLVWAAASRPWQRLRAIPRESAVPDTRLVVLGSSQSS